MMQFRINIRNLTLKIHREGNKISDSEKMNKDILCFVTMGWIFYAVDCR